MFDTHLAVRELTKAGFAEAQAEAIVAMVGVAMSDDLATKTDLANLRVELKEDIAGVKADVSEVRADVAALKVQVTEIKAGVAEVKVQVAANSSAIASIETRLLLKMTGIGIALLGAGLAIMRLFPA